MRKQVMVVMLLLLGFAGVGSSAVVTRALGHPHTLSAVQHEKQIGPKPLPRWYWRWVSGAWARDMRKGISSKRACAQGRRHARSQTGLGNGCISS